MKRRCVFLDRDGVINEPAAPGDYIRRWEDFHLLPGITDWIRLFNVLGFLVIVVTNQRGVALGRMTARDVDDIHRRMQRQLAEAGARIDDIFCCMHEEDTCDCRKPKPGMVREAAAKWNIDVAASVLIGDSERDRQLAVACGMKFIRVSGGIIQEIC